MTRSSGNPFGQPSLEDLMVRFLATRSDAAATAVESGEGEVEPHEVATGFRVDPRAAWNDATTPIDAAAPASPPPDWGTIVNQSSPVCAIAMALGNFPQRVRDLHLLMVRFEPAEMRPGQEHNALHGFSSLRTWIARNALTQPLLSAGLARLLGDFDSAGRILAAQSSSAAENERAALLWHAGKCEEALSAWEAAVESPAVLFNRGMAMLFLGKIAAARTALNAAAAAIPESSGWNHLARLYLAVAEIHG